MNSVNPYFFVGEVVAKDVTKPYEVLQDWAMDVNKTNMWMSPNNLNSWGLGAMKSLVKTLLWGSKRLHSGQPINSSGGLCPPPQFMGSPEGGDSLTRPTKSNNLVLRKIDPWVGWLSETVLINRQTKNMNLNAGLVGAVVRHMLGTRGLRPGPDVRPPYSMLRPSYCMLRNSAPGPEIVLPESISAGF